VPPSLVVSVLQKSCYAWAFYIFTFPFVLDKMFYSLEFSEVILNESSNEYEVPLPDYTSIIEELRSHRQEIKKLHQECILPSAELEGFILL